MIKYRIGMPEIFPIILIKSPRCVNWTIDIKIAETHMADARFLGLKLN